jgi:hypothetical protein
MRMRTRVRAWYSEQREAGDGRRAILLADRHFTDLDTTGVPTYPDGKTTWISTDYSLQLSISLVQWGEWQQHQHQPHEPRRFESTLPGR